MAFLSVQLSNFRVTPTANAPASSFYVAVHSPRAHANPLQSPLCTRQEDGSFTFPSWQARWNERVPDSHSVLYVALRAADNRSKWKKPHSLIATACGIKSSRRTIPLLAKASFNLFSLSTGTVHRSVALGNNNDSHTGFSFHLSFDAVVEERADVRINLNDVSVCCPFPLRSAYLVVKVPDTKPLCVVGPERHVHSSEPQWDTIPTLVLPEWSLSKLAHGTLIVRVHEAQDGNRCVGTMELRLHDIWASVIKRNYAAPFQGELQPPPHESLSITPGSIRGFVQIDNFPRTGQMAGGVTTDTGLTGGRPIFCGAVLPVADRIRGEGSDSQQLPPGWVQLVDTFGYHYYHHTPTSRDSWLKPTSGAELPDHNADLSALGYERTNNNFYRSVSSGVETWVHPSKNSRPMRYSQQHEVTRLAARPSSRPQCALGTHDNNRTLSSSTLSVDEPTSNPASTNGYHRYGAAVPVQLSEQCEEELSFTDALEVDAPSGGPSEFPAIPDGRISLCDDRSFCTEMRWQRLPSRGLGATPGPSTEGHTLTAMKGGQYLLKFGGSSVSSDKTNRVFAFDSSTLNWQPLAPLGVPPVPRFGHGAVAMGSDRSRLLIFGGSCRRGRLNDLHILHCENRAWSPVSATGEPPGVRSRCGMTATSAGDLALVFGGRSIYRFLGGTYYDAKYVHAFYADREQWVQMEPRGPGRRPSPRSGCVVEFVNDRHMFVHGGYDDGDKYYSDTFLFDLATSSWQEIPYPDEPTVPSARESHASTVVNGSVLIYGGESERDGYLSDLHMFDPGRLRWVDAPPVSGYSPGGLTGAAMATMSTGQVMLTGGDNGYLVSGEAYTLDIAHFPLSDIDSLKEKARERGLLNNSCVICLAARAETMFIWCGHVVCCKGCAQRVGSVCPICRQPCVKKVYDIQT